MSSKLGLNLRVTQWGNQGGRAYMEDRYAVHFESNYSGGFVFAYFGIFDGHGGAEAAKFARDNLLAEITKYNEFWTNDDDEICKCIKAGFLDTHQAMWKELDKWPRTQSGFPSTSGTTASIAIIKNCKLYVGHVGDSCIVLGQRHCLGDGKVMTAVQLTKDHKPESPEERIRIERSGGSVQVKSGIQRVVWNRPKRDHQGPVRRSTPIDKIPFLAVARSLGDLWSYDYTHKEFAVSPEPDVSVHVIDTHEHKLLILGSDGLWNMMSPMEACRLVDESERVLETKIVQTDLPLTYTENTAMKLVTHAVQKWGDRRIKADNVTAVVIHMEPYSYHRATDLMFQRRTFRASSDVLTTNEQRELCLHAGYLDPTMAHPALLSPSFGQNVRAPSKSLSDSQLLTAILDDNSNGCYDNREKILPTLISGADVPAVGSEVIVNEVIVNKVIVNEVGAKDCDMSLDGSLNRSALTDGRSSTGLVNGVRGTGDGLVNGPSHLIGDSHEAGVADEEPVIEGKRIVVVERERVAKNKDLHLVHGKVASCCLIDRSETKSMIRDYIVQRRHMRKMYRQTPLGYRFVGSVYKTPEPVRMVTQHRRLKSASCVDKIDAVNSCITRQLTLLNPFYRLKQKFLSRETASWCDTYLADAGVKAARLEAPLVHTNRGCIQPPSGAVLSVVAYTDSSVPNQPSSTKEADRAPGADPSDVASDMTTSAAAIQSGSGGPVTSSISNNVGVVLRSRNKISPTKSAAKQSKHVAKRLTNDSQACMGKEQVSFVGESDKVRAVRMSARRSSMETTQCLPTSRMVRRLRSALKRKKCTKSPAYGQPTVKRLRRAYDIHSR